MVAALCAAVITTVGAVNMALPASAVRTYENRQYWTTGWLNKDYWCQDNYWENKNQRWVGTLAYLCNPLYYNGMGSQTLAVTEGRTVAKQTSTSYATALGMSVAYEGIGVNTSSTYSVSQSITITYSHTQSYSATLTPGKNATGFYVWEARNKFYKFVTYLYWRPNTRSRWTYQRSGKAVSFTNRTPYFQLVRTTNNPC